MQPGWFIKPVTVRIWWCFPPAWCVNGSFIQVPLWQAISVTV